MKLQDHQKGTELLQVIESVEEATKRIDKAYRDTPKHGCVTITVPASVGQELRPHLEQILTTAQSEFDAL